MHGQECEWGGFTVTAIVVFVVLFLIAVLCFETVKKPFQLHKRLKNDPKISNF